MSERPDLFVNKKSSLAEIIEVRIDATCSGRGANMAPNILATTSKCPLGWGNCSASSLLEGRLETLRNRSLTRLFQEIRCDIDMSPHSAELSFLRYATRRG